MAIHRGIQSAIFYYLSCAPCAEARYRRQRKEEAARGRADREALEAEMPNLYRHPSPSSTNPHWDSEIAAGPTLSGRGGRRKGGYSQNNDSQRRLKSPTTPHSDTSNMTSSVDLNRASGSRDDHRDPSFHLMASAERLPSRSTTVSASIYDGGGGITRPAPALTRRDDPMASYTSFGNPHVNDLVPAIATQVRSHEEAQMIMQGPPSSEVMSGRDGSMGRTRSDSGGSSRLSARSAGIPLSREVSRRTIERKLQNGEIIPRQSLSRALNDPTGQRHDRGTTESRDFAQLSANTSREDVYRSSPPSRAHESEDSTLSSLTVLHDPLLVPPPIRAASNHRAASRPQLSTIVSSDNVSSTDSSNPPYLTVPSYPDENGPPLHRAHSDTSLPAIERDTPLPATERDRTSRRSPLLLPSATEDPAMHILHGQKPPQLLSDPIVPGRIIASRTATTNPAKDPKTRNLSIDSLDESGQALFDSWYTPDLSLNLPEWVHEHTKREVSQRWSMDI